MRLPKRRSRRASSHPEKLVAPGAVLYFANVPAGTPRYVSRRSRRSRRLCCVEAMRSCTTHAYLAHRRRPGLPSSGAELENVPQGQGQGPEDHNRYVPALSGVLCSAEPVQCGFSTSRRPMFSRHRASSRDWCNPTCSRESLQLARVTPDRLLEGAEAISAPMRG